MRYRVYSATLVLALLIAAAGQVWAGNPGDDKPPAPPVAATNDSDYIIGPEDVLNVNVWKEAEISSSVPVRPDGKISLPLLNDVQAAGLTPNELRDRLVGEAGRYLEEPNVTVVVRQINSRKVFVTGEVAKPGPYVLGGPTTVLQMLAIAGGLKEYADSKHIVVMRTENNQAVIRMFNYKDASKRKSLKQNIDLKPGDTIIVP